MGQWVKSRSGSSSLDDLQEILVALISGLGVAVDLSGEEGFCPQNSARRLSLGGTDAGGFFQRLSPDPPLASGQVEGRHPVSRGGVTGDGPAATGFGVVRMGANYYDFQTAVPLGLLCGSLALACGESQHGAAGQYTGKPQQVTSRDRSHVIPP